MKNNIIFEKIFRHLYISRIIFVLFISFYAFTVFSTYNLPQHILTDAAYYLMGAENIASGNGFVSYNVGYLADTSVNDFKTLVPITRYQPFYSFLVGNTAHISGTSVLLAAQIVNFIAYGIFLIMWLLLYKKIFQNTKLFFIASLFLLFTSGIFTYIIPPHTEMLFLALLGILGNTLYWWHKTENSKYKYLFTALLASITVLILLTRYAGIGMVLGFALTFFFFLLKLKWKEIAKHIVLFGTIFVTGFGLWAWRNLQAAGTVTSKFPDNYHGTLFDWERIIEILNHFITFSLGLPSSFEKYYFLLLLPLMFFAGWLIYKKSFSTNPLNIWFVVSLLVYVAMIVYLGIGNRAVSRENGFMRFFFLTQPFLIGVIMNMIPSFRLLPQTFFTKLSQLFILGIVAISLLSGVNRTRIYFQNLPNYDIQQDFYSEIKNTATQNDLILSNEWQNVSANTSLPIVQINYLNDIDSLKTKYKNKYSKVYLALHKDVGITYREGVHTWEKLLENKIYTVITENEETIFVEIE